MPNSKAAIEKLKVFDDFVPHRFLRFDSEYMWCKINSREDFNDIMGEINEDWGDFNNIKAFPEFVCIEIDCDHTSKTETTLEILMEEYRQFLKEFGIKVIYEEDKKL